MDVPVAPKMKWLSAGIVALAVIAVVAVSFSIYLTQQNRQLSSSVNDKNVQMATLQKQQAPQTPTPVADPYAGWKTYCDTVEKTCFKYPADWTLDPSNKNGIVSVTVENSTKSLVGSYTNYDTRDSAQAPYYVAALEGRSTINVSYKALGGFVASAATVSPQYKVVDSTPTTGLIVGQQASVANTARFTFK